MNKNPTPIFADYARNGYRVFRADPRVVNDRHSHILKNNLVYTLLLIVALICGVALYAFSPDIESMLNYVARLMIIFSAIMIIMLVASTPQTLAQETKKITQIYLKVVDDRIQGLTVDKNDKSVYVDVAIEEIDKIVYNPKVIAIYMKNGLSFSYDVFSNPREVYNAITAAGELKEKEEIEEKAL